MHNFPCISNVSAMWHFNKSSVLFSKHFCQGSLVEVSPTAGALVTQSWLPAICHSGFFFIYPAISFLSPPSLSSSHSTSPLLNICDMSPSTCLWIRGWDWQAFLHGDSCLWALWEKGKQKERECGREAWVSERMSGEGLSPLNHSTFPPLLIWWL